VGEKVEEGMKTLAGEEENKKKWKTCGGDTKGYPYSGSSYRGSGQPYTSLYSACVQHNRHRGPYPPIARRNAVEVKQKTFFLAEPLVTMMKT
jgi:hypothetical protein